MTEPDDGPEVVEPEKCLTNKDCDGVIELATCEAAVCIKASGDCVAVDALEGAACAPDGVPVESLDCWAGTCTADGECVAEALTNSACDDASACTVGDVCQDGTCQGTPKDCGDANVCTTDSCDPTSGACMNSPVEDALALACEDGNACTAGDVCAAGACAGGENGCACQSDGDCATQDDGDLCNGTLVCEDGACVVDDSTVVMCDASQDGACQVTTCAPESGDCSSTILQGSGCDDGDACTFGDKCTGQGQCAGAPQNCDDGNVCTFDTCAEGNCANATMEGPCNDEEPCTVEDACKGGTCEGAAKTCSDGNDCTNDFCGDDGVCVFEPNEGGGCDDGNPCTMADTCSAGLCAGSKTDCNDDNPCTLDGCLANNVPEDYDPAIPTSACQHLNKPGSCSDGDACTTSDTCDKGVCEGGPKPDCSTTTPCKTGQCDSNTGCIEVNVNNGAACDDGSSCTEDETCQAGVCGGGTDVCDCEKDSDCDDNLPCNGVETCADSGGGILKCKAGPPVVCEETKDLCTTSQCEPGSGNCQLVNDNPGKACGADTKCETDRVCNAGVCAGKPIPCKEITCKDVAGCDAEKGCAYTNAQKGTACNDGSECTDPDQCDGTGDCDGSKVTCDDNNACTVDSCSAQSGCVFTPLKNGTTCDVDNNACTNDVCSSGKCLGSKPLVCDDGVACTDDQCNAQTGVCEYTPNNANCDDKNGCTTDTCTANGCSNSSVTDFTDCSDLLKGNIDFCFSGECVGSVAVDANYPVISLCSQTSKVAIDMTLVAGKAFLLGNYQAEKFASFPTLGCDGKKTAYTELLELSGTGTLAYKGSASGTGNVLEGRAAVGNDGFSGLIKSDGSSVEWNDANLDAALTASGAATADLFGAGTVTISTFSISGITSTEYYLVGGRSNAGQGFGLRCAGGGSKNASFKCSALTFSGGANAANQNFVGASLSTSFKLGSVSLDEGWMISNSNDKYLDWYQSDGGSLAFTNKGSQSAVTANGVVAIDNDEALIYGDNGYVRHCKAGSCAATTAPSANPMDWKDAYRYSAGIVLVGIDGLNAEIAFFKYGGTPNAAKSWVTYSIPNSGTPAAVVVNPSVGIYVLEQAMSGGKYRIHSWLK